MTNRSNNGTVGGLAREIQRRLADAQGPADQPSSTAAPQENQTLRVTKSGVLLQPGQEAPRDENGNPVPTTSIPDATFHSGAGEQ